MRKASTRLPEQGTQTPSPAPDLIPAETEKQLRTHFGISRGNGGTSRRYNLRPVAVEKLTASKVLRKTLR